LALNLIETGSIAKRFSKHASDAVYAVAELITKQQKHRTIIGCSSHNYMRKVSSVKATYRSAYLLSRGTRQAQE